MMEAYNSYKDSGINWCERIPSSWTVASLKWYSSIYSGGTPSRNESSYWFGGNIPWLNSGVVNQFIIEKCSDYITEDGLKNSSAKWIPINSVVIALAGQGKTKGMVGETTFRATCNQSLGVIVPMKKVFHRYLLYYLFSNYQNIRNLGGGDKRDGINLEMIGNISLLIPSLEEQELIAAYLDKKTEQIDRIIKAKQELVELYEEEKQVIINELVTGKKIIVDDEIVNPENTKDSGVKWLGNIPKDWQVKRFKYWFDLITSKNEESKIKVGLENIESKTGKFLETGSDFNGIGIDFVEDDILFGKLRPYLAKVYQAEFKGQAVGDFYIFRSNDEVNPSFASMRLLSNDFIDIVNSSSYGSKMPRASWEFISNLKIALPHYEQQIIIADFISKKTSEIDQFVKKAVRLINLLTEYRTTLINDVVTGKINVTNQI